MKKKSYLKYRCYNLYNMLSRIKSSLVVVVIPIGIYDISFYIFFLNIKVCYLYFVVKYTLHKVDFIWVGLFIFIF